MKRLFFFVMAVFFAFTANAKQSYSLPFVEVQNGVTKIPFIPNEWVLGAERADWSLYMEKGMLQEHKQMYEFHAATIYKEPYYSNATKTEISIIYTYGVLNCNEGNLYILNEWYVDPDETLVFRSSHEFSSYIVDMTTPDAARNDVYNQICKETI